MGRTESNRKGDEMDYRMSIDEAVESRHAVRRYTEEPISAEERAALEEAVAAANADGALHMRLAYDDPEVFSSTLARRAGFVNANNYLVVAGHESNNLDMRAGYFAEKVVLEAQRLGLNSCWVAGTAKRRAVRQTLAQKDKLVAIIADDRAGVPAGEQRARVVCARRALCTARPDGHEPADLLGADDEKNECQRASACCVEHQRWPLRPR